MHSLSSLSSLPSRPRNRLVLPLLLLMLLLAVPAYTPAFAQDAGAPVAPADAASPGALAPGEYLEIAYVDQLAFRWNDAGSGADRDGSFWQPVAPGGWFALGSYGIGSGVGSAYGPVLVARELAANSLAAPAGYQMIWADYGSGADNDGSFWKPIPPANYTCLGTVARAGYDPPSVNDIRCVRTELTIAAKYEASIWDDQGSGADSDFSAWQVLPVSEGGPEAGLTLGTFVGVGGYSHPAEPARTLAAAYVKAATATQAEVDSMIATYGPVIALHPTELYLPDSVDYILNNGTTMCRGLIHNPDDYATFMYEDTLCYQTNAANLLDTVADSEQDPRFGTPDYDYFMQVNNAVTGGSMSRAKAYVRATRYSQAFVELQFWIYYPFNGSGKFYLQIGDVESYHVLTNPAGRHYGDWEVVTVRLGKDANDGIFKPMSFYMSRHGTNQVLAWRDPALQKYLTNHPIAFAARDSHAHYPNAATQYYERVGDTNIGVGTVNVDLEDWTAYGGPALGAFQSGRYEIVSSDFPGVAATNPDWLGFFKRWGQNERLSFTYTYDYLFDDYSYTQEEVGRGPSGPQTKSLWPQYDSTPPTILAVISGGSPNGYGWRNVPTTLSWSVSDTQSPVNIKKYCDPVTVSNAAGADYRCIAASNGGFKSATARLYVDTGLPTTSIASPQPVTYDQGTTFFATWNSYDTMSGMLSSVATLDGNPVGVGQPINPASLSEGQHTFTVTATDLAGNVDVKSVTFTVAAAGDYNVPPAFTSTPPYTVSVGATYLYTITTSDPDQAAPPNIVAPIVPNFLTFTNKGDGTATLNGTTSAANLGVHEVNLLAVDDQGATDSQTFYFEVITATAALTGRVEGTVYVDTNGNKQFDSGEGIGTVEVKVEYAPIAAQTAGGAAVTESKNTLSNPDGSYSFADVAPTTYFVSFVAPVGFTMAITNPVLITVTSSQTTTVPPRELIANGFANPTVGNISGIIFADANGNKQPDPREGVAGAQITADSGSSAASVDSPTFKQTTTSGNDGSYLFPAMAPGAYTLTFEAPPGYKLPSNTPLILNVTAGQTVTAPPFGVNAIHLPVHMPIVVK